MNHRGKTHGETPLLLQAQALTLRRGGRVLSRDLSFDVRAGSCWVILGPNGAGKSTLLSALGGFIRPAQGTVIWAGEELSRMDAMARARYRAFLGTQAGDVFGVTVFDSVLAGRHPHTPAWQWESGQDIDAVQRALQRFGLGALAEHDVRTLSAGERQRVALAALLAQEPMLYLLDEPAAHLDPAQQIAALDALLDSARAAGAAVVMVLHELHLAIRYADRVLLLHEGSASQGPAESMLTEERLSQLFGTRMMRLSGERGAGTFIPRDPA